MNYILKLNSLFFLLYLLGNTTVILAQNEVKIGNQIWMTKNLDVDRFRNGDTIPRARTAEEWIKAGEEGKPAWCYYNNDPSNGKKFGRLYNWYAVKDRRGLAPEGWHIPNDAEWNELVNFLGGKETAGIKMKNKNGWGKEGNGTNESGFAGLPGGSRNGYGIFNNIGYNSNWWSSSDVSFEHASPRSLSRYYKSVTDANWSKKAGLSVRCIKD